MKQLVLYGAMPLLLALTACPSAQPGHSPVTTVAPAAPVAALADFRRPGYAVYRGLVAGAADSVTLHLTIAPAQPDSSAVGEVRGTYYGADGEPHELSQSSSAKQAASDSLLLVYYSPPLLSSTADQQDIRWRLRRQANGHLLGTVGGRAAQLRPLRPALAFTVSSSADSVAAFPGRAHSPYGHVGLQMLVPVGTSPVALAVAANLRRQLRGDSLPSQPVPALPHLWAQQRADFAKMYRGEAAEMVTEPVPSPADSADFEAYQASLRFDSQRNLVVLCQEGHLLSVRLLSYEYSGGAHGSFGSEVRSFDLRTGRALRFDDIFRPEARQQLLPLLDRGVRHTLGLSATEPLREQLLVDKIHVTPNVCLTPGGVLFVYPPYDIAAYALGEVTVFLPLATVRPLLREGLPLPRLGPGVARR